MGDLGLKAAVGMGLAQSLALMPGVSRSGITISAGRLLQLDRDSAARFSFLLLVPTVLGAVLLKGVKDVLLGDLPAGWVGPFVVGTLAAAGSGLIVDLGAPRLRAPPRLLDLRLVPADRRRDRRAADRDGRPLQPASEAGRGANGRICVQLDITLILVHSRNGVEAPVRGHT